MNRLQLELNRLYGWGAASTDEGAAGAGHAAREGGVRVLVLELALPAGWEQLSSVWKGVQSDLDLPAPAIAVSGIDGLQLWFSLATPMPRSSGALFLERLRARYLPDVGARQVRLIAAPAELPPLPPAEIGTERWAAFVTPDLASVFAETPWLDMSPTDEGQATLLRALEPIRQADFEAALAQLGVTGAEAPREAATAMLQASPGTAAGLAARDADPVRFLAGVMNDETVPLALRIEAAKALLPHARRSPESPAGTAV